MASTGKGFAQHLNDASLCLWLKERMCKQAALTRALLSVMCWLTDGVNYLQPKEHCDDSGILGMHHFYMELAGDDGGGLPDNEHADAVLPMPVHCSGMLFPQQSWQLFKEEKIDT